MVRRSYIRNGAAKVMIFYHTIKTFSMFFAPLLKIFNKIAEGMARGSMAGRFAYPSSRIFIIAPMNSSSLLFEIEVYQG